MKKIKLEMENKRLNAIIEAYRHEYYEDHHSHMSQKELEQNIKDIEYIRAEF